MSVAAFDLKKSFTPMFANGSFNHKLEENYRRKIRINITRTKSEAFVVKMISQ